MTDSEKMINFQKNINYSFSNLNLLYEALSHSSYVNERKTSKIMSNERLEFLGDAVLELITSEYLFLLHNDIAEGELSKLRAGMVCEKALAACARQVYLGEYLMLGKGELNCNGANRDSILSDAMEAVIGAVYLDGGFHAAKELVTDYIVNFVNEKEYFIDNKTMLQEIAQAKHMGITEYILLDMTGPEHNRVFKISVRIDGNVYGTGIGKNKKEAEQSAAYEAIKRLNKQ